MRPTYSLSLHSRTEMVGNRRVQIHEMTDSEIRWLRDQRWAFGAMGVALGGVPTLLYFMWVIRAYCGQ